MTNPVSFTNQENYDSVITAWNQQGELLWWHQLAAEESNRIYRMEVDSENRLWVAGDFNGAVNWQFGSETLSLSNPVSEDTFALQFDPQGNLLNAAQWSHDSNSSRQLVATDQNGNLFLATDFSETLAAPTGDVYQIPESVTRNAVLTRWVLAPGVSVGPTSGLVTSESGGSDSFSVVLETAPSSNVTVTLNSSDTSEGIPATSSVVFTPSNWNIPQTVWINGVDDGEQDGDIPYTIITSATSSDPGYNGLAVADVLVTNLDNEAPPFEPTVVFGDSFEKGQWDGKWNEDSQNDWFTSSQRSTEGNASAEVDGRASNATLTSIPIDLSEYGSVELSFDWLIESSLDNGEYLAVDFRNGSGQWIEQGRLQGNSDPENTWHDEFFDLSEEFLHEDFQLRFRASMSWYNEDANVDNVEVLATSLAAPPTSPDDLRDRCGDC